MKKAVLLVALTAVVLVTASCADAPSDSTARERPAGAVADVGEP